MARKLSRVAHCVIWITAATVVGPERVFAQGDVRVSSTSKRVVNPFAAKREVEAQTGAQAPATIAPMETTGPKTYQNPFSKQKISPRFVTPRLQPGPMSRWHRTVEPTVSHADQRPVHAVLQDSEIGVQQLDLSGPLAVQQKRTALFAVPTPQQVAEMTPPPDPARFGADLNQPAWLVPDSSHQAASADAVSQSFDDVRAAAQETIDPFESSDPGAVVVSDDATKTIAPVQIAKQPEPVTPKPKKPEPVVLKRHEPEPQVLEPSLPEPKVVELTIPNPAPEKPAQPIIKPALPQTPHLEPAVTALPNPERKSTPIAPPTAGELYAKAEHAAAEAAATNELAAVVQLCVRGLESEPNAELKKSFRSLAAWACNRTGEIESDRRREDEALKAFELAIQWDPSCWLALHNRAVSRAQQGDLNGAMSDFNRALQLNPGLAVAYRNRGELLAATGRTEEAVADYTTALAQMPQDAELYAKRGEAHHRLGQYDEALADMSQAIEIEPLNAIAYAQRGNVFAEQGRFEQAITDFQKALTLDADSAEAHRSLAWVLATCPDEKFRNPQQALVSAERAAALMPGDPFMLDALAAAQANAGQFDRAVRCQQEAILNVPSDYAPPFRERLALYEQQRPFRNGASDIVDENVRAASLETAPTQLPPR